MINREKDETGINCTINTTEDCNLRCKYCYEINKSKKDIPFDYCKKFIDALIETDNFADLSDDDDVLSTNIYKQGIILDFIGGDALINPDLLDKICTYFVTRVMTIDTPNAKYWRNHMRFSLSSNGTLFSRPEVRKFCEKWAKSDLLYVGVSIDGCPTIHDKNRIMAERGEHGEELGSMKFILENWEWYRKTFPRASRATKSTLAKDSIPYMFESIKFMHEELGLNMINQNFIMEDAHLTEEDYAEFDKQMGLCVKYVLEHCDDLYWSMIDKDTFANHRLSKGDDWEKRGHCGSGAMPCLGINGNIYPCFRWCPHTQSSSNPEPMIVGDVWHGFTHRDVFKKVREGAYKCNCTIDDKCKTCEYESACSYCIGGCFAEFQEFKRTTYICEITKLQCKWAKIYWNEYNKKKGLPLEFDAKFSF